jgi:hypothetical protein
MSGPRLLLMQLSERTSAKGTAYLSGWLGKARLVGFKAKELDPYGNPQWEIYAAEPEQKPNGDQAPRSISTRNAERGQARWDRSRDVERHATRSKAAAAGEAILAERDRQREGTPADWLDDSAEAVRDLTEGAGR